MMMKKRSPPRKARIKGADQKEKKNKGLRMNMGTKNANRKTNTKPKVRDDTTTM